MNETETAFLCDKCGNKFTERPIEVEVHASGGQVVHEWWCWECFYGREEARCRKNCTAAGLNYEEFVNKHRNEGF